MIRGALTALVVGLAGAFGAQALEPPQTHLYDTMFGPWPAPPSLSDLDWLATKPDPVALITRPRARDVPRNVSALVELGRLAFRYPGTLGGYAARHNLSCNVCHTGGQAQTSFLFEPYSRKAGTIDITNALFNPAGEDNKNNAVKIPDLRKARAPYGTVVPMDDLNLYISRHTQIAFGGSFAHPLITEALSAYVHALKLKPSKGSELADSAARKAGRPEQMIRIAFDDVDRAMGVIEAAIDAEDARLTRFAVDATRSELGRVHERLDPRDPARETLKVLSQQLRELGLAVARDNNRAARGFADLVREQLVTVRDEILSRADLTFYSEDHLRAALDPASQPVPSPEKKAGQDQ